MKRKFISFLFFLMIFTFPFYSQSTDKTFYISSSSGKDTNDGKSRNKPLRTFKGLREKYGMGKDKIIKNAQVLFKCGDTFYESIHHLEECKISSYEIGDKPVICGFRILTNNEDWEKTEEGIWRLDMRKAENFSGFPLALLTNKYVNNIGVIYDSGTDKLHGHIVSSMSGLVKKWDILTVESSIVGKDDPASEYIYVKHEDPRQEKNLCFSVYEHGLYRLWKCAVSDISIKGFGGHGICFSESSFIESVTLDIIGGTLQLPNTQWVRYGNGIEFWISESEDFTWNYNTVRDCRISRTYDCGVTIQGRGENMNDAIANKFQNNLFYHCRQAFEHFLADDSGRKATYIDCEFTGNICLEMGINEFDSPEIRDANILSYDRRKQPVKIYDNVFFGGNHYCGANWSTNMGRNVIYIYRGQYLNNYNHSSTYPTIYANTEEDILSYRDRLEDWTSIIHIMERNYNVEKLFKEISLVHPVSFPFIEKLINQLVFSEGKSRSKRNLSL